MARKERRYHYIYKITCLKNGKYYIGMHSTDNLEDGYMGGGKRIKNSIKKYGKDAHRKEILGFFENREDLRNREIQLVNEELLNDPMCMNLQPGGGGGLINEEHRQKFLKSGIEGFKKIIKDPEYREKFSLKCSEAMKKRWKDPDQRKILNSNKSFYGKSHSEEAKKLIGSKNAINQKGSGNSMFGKIWINHKNLGERVINKEELGSYLNDGWERGRSEKIKNTKRKQ